MVAELNTITDAFDACMMLSADISTVLMQTVTISIYNDTKEVFDFIRRGNRSTRKRLAIDVTAATKACRTFYVDLVGLVCGENSPIDAFNKIRINNSSGNLINPLLVSTSVQKPIIKNAHDAMRPKRS